MSVPIGIQFFGSNPDMFAEAVRRTQELKPDFIDINAGCPSKRIVSRGCGSALMKDLSLLEKIVERSVSVSEIPVSVKMRAGWDNSTINVVEASIICEQAGADALIVHPRTKAQGFSGTADWTLVGEVKSRVKIPVIGSGDIWSAEDARQKLEMYGADAVMIGRAALGNPWIFRQYNEMMNGVFVPGIPDISERLALGVNQLKTIMEEKNEKFSVIFMRKFFAWYSKGAKRSAEFRQEIYKALTLAGVESTIEKYLAYYDKEDPENL